MKRTSALLCVILLFAATSCRSGLSPHNVAVVVNSVSTESVAVGRYYCERAGIPLSNLIQVQTRTDLQISRAEYALLAQSIRNALVAQLHVDSSDPAGDPIQVLVLCYRIPAKITGPDGSNDIDAVTSVDSYLTMLLNQDPDLGPDVVPDVRNPYHGQDQDFATFRTSAANSTSYNGQTFKMRYLVCRLDGFGWPLVNVPGFGTMPKDARDLIDRAAASSGQRGRFVLDEPWNSVYGHHCYDFAANVLMDGGGVPVVHDAAASECFVNMFDDSTGVMGYASYGMHDADVVADTYWSRPDFNWKPGAVAIVNESYGGMGYIWTQNTGWSPDDTHGTVTSVPSLQVVANVTAVESDGSKVIKPLTNYRVSLRTYDGTRELASAYVRNVEIDGVVNGVADIDLTDPAIQWPQDDHRTQVRLYYPDDDGGFRDREESSWAAFWCGEGNNYDLYAMKEMDQGLRITVLTGRQKSSEFIRNGCSGVNAAVSEPGADFVGTAVSFPRYAAGYSFAEAVYMDTSFLCFKTIMFGDPLMAPYATPPAVVLDAPSVDGTTLSGVVTISAWATASNAPGIRKVEFWLSDGQNVNALLGTRNSPPYGLAFDTTSLPAPYNQALADGRYVLEAVAYEENNASELGRASRPVVVDNGGSASTLSIASPDADGAILSGISTVDITADPSGPGGGSRRAVAAR